MINIELGYIVIILDAKVEPMGKMIPGDGGTFHKVEFNALTFYPMLQEIVNGELVETTVGRTFVYDVTPSCLKYEDINNAYKFCK